MTTYRATPDVIHAYATARGLSERAGEDELLRLAELANEAAGDVLRYRSRADRLDVSMRLHNGCIVAVTVREYRGSGRGSAARRKAARTERRRRERGE